MTVVLFLEIVLIRMCLKIVEVVLHMLLAVVRILKLDYVMTISFNDLPSSVQASYPTEPTFVSVSIT